MPDLLCDIRTARTLLHQEDRTTTAPEPAAATGLIHRNRPVRKCDRCHRQTGDYRWSAASKCAEKFHAELSLCAGCLQALRSFLAGYENKVRQKQQAAARN